ncbi:MAG: hypothetical protein FJ410_09595 [Verrucomicrobia bacterium]|nr:hypothetical protein [Verrucomicrobiota bacterium]
MPHMPLAALCVLLSSVLLSAEPAARWYKGNLHTHTFWSDGDDFPDSVARWYKDNGYHFLALSDHNVMQQGEKWFVPAKRRGGKDIAEKYLAAFTSDRVKVRGEGDAREIRLKTFDELQAEFGEAGRFLMIPSIESTDSRVHVNVTNLRDPILPDKAIDTSTSQGIVAAMRHALETTRAQRAATGRPMFAHLNHPNFKWAVTAEEILQVDQQRFFEVYNGHPTVYNEGDAVHASTERMWDIILAERLGRLGQPALFGLATDDSHNYHIQPDRVNAKSSVTGRGWVMVRADELTPDALVAAIEKGDFYCSTGVTLKDVVRTADSLTVEVDPEPGLQYTVEFIGTRRGYDHRSEPVKDDKGEVLHVTRRYSEDVGRVLQSSKGVRATYKFKGDELYVRARVTSSRHKSPIVIAGEMERAWTQP